MRTKATAFAPATVANVAVGFDLLGHAVTAVGDCVTAVRVPGRGGIVIEEVSGVAGITLDPRRNTATAGLYKFLRDTRANFGLAIRIRKGIAIGSGMGGSAASAVGAVVAANALLARPLSAEKLFPYALLGEAVASGAVHGDNVAPCLFGGLCLVRSADPMDVVALRAPRGLLCVLVHPHLKISTRAARRMLKPTVRLHEHVAQSANLAGVLAGCFSGDTALIGRSLADLVIEPQRKRLVPGFDAAKSAALRAGALGFSLSGSGPSVFAWTSSRAAAARVRSAVLGAFRRRGIAADSWISPIGAPGARVIG